MENPSTARNMSCGKCRNSVSDSVEGSVTTFSKEIVDFWKKEGFGATERYVADGYVCWTIPVPSGHTKIRDPEHVGLLIAEKSHMARILRTRLVLPLYTVKKDGKYADVHGDGGPGMPLARTKKMMRSFIGPGPKVVKLSTRDTARKVVGNGTGLVYYVVKKNLCETFSKQEALNAL